MDIYDNIQCIINYTTDFTICTVYRRGRKDIVVRSKQSKSQPIERQLKVFLRLGRTLKKGVKSQKANQLYDHRNETRGSVD